LGFRFVPAAIAIAAMFAQSAGAHDATPADAQPAVAPNTLIPQGSATYDNYLAARAWLEKAIAAHGMAADPNAERDVLVRYKGDMKYVGNWNAPTAVQDYGLEGAARFSMRRHALAHESRMIRGDRHRDSRAYVSGRRVAYQPSGDAPLAEIADPDEARKSAQDTWSTLPNYYLNEARDRAVSLRLLQAPATRATPPATQPGDAASETIMLAYCDVLDRQVTLLIDPATRLVSGVEVLAASPQRGDETEIYRWMDYSDVGGMRMPAKHTIRKGHETWIVDYDVSLPDEPFSVAELTPNSDELKDAAAWTIADPDHPNDPYELEQIASGLWMVALPQHDSRAMLVAMADHMIVLEAPIDAPTGALMLRAAKKIRPDLPVKYVVVSHHHFHYCGGLRPFVKAGVTIVTTPNNTVYYRELAGRSHRIQPDGLQRSPCEPKFLVVTDRHKFEDAANCLEVCEIGANPGHTDEYLTNYFPREKMVFVGDLVSFPLDGSIPPTDAWIRAFVAGVKKHNLDVKTVRHSWPIEGKRPTVSWDECIQSAEKQP
jgi:glyoxylase-like metal-dependent hydrolase (beta-lactamase superfamily II)